MNTCANILYSMAFAIFVSAPVMLGFRACLLETVDKKADAMRVPTLFRFFRKSTLYFKSIRLLLLYALIATVIALPSHVCSVFADSLLPTQILPEGNDFISLAELQEILRALIPALLKAGVVTALGALLSCALLPLYYMYGFAHIIMADYPNAGVIEALRTSRNLMRGKKWKLFCLDFSFIGWYLLAALFTCGIGILFVIPYHYTARALFYNDIGQRDAAKDTEFPSLDPEDYADDVL